MSRPGSDPWWKSAVVYQIYPRSFCDTTGNGIGDLEGVRRRLDHLKWLGVDAIWLSPFFRSPMRDYGYDVSDYCDVDPLFGTLSDFDRLLGDAHERGIRVLIDWVPNHTSDLHPWFIEARASRDAPKRDWYVWRDGSPDRPPNNWRSAFTGGPAWTWDDATRQWYLHLFLPEQPDLDWNTPAVVEAMHDTLRFWLDRGVDGFRMDVIHCIGKDPALADVRDDLVSIPVCALNDDPRTHDLLRGIRSVIEEYPGDRVMVGEVYLMSTSRVAEYYGRGDELHLAFNFPPLYAPWEAGAWRERIDEVSSCVEPQGWPTWVLSNHDNPRHATRYGSEARARCAAVLLVTLRGTPFLYAGEELGLEDVVIEEDRRVDPGGRDGCRAPIPWTKELTHGWASAEPWLPWPPDAADRSPAAQRSDKTSILHLYRDLLALRRASRALQSGSFSWAPSPGGVLAYVRDAPGDRRAVVVNYTDRESACPVTGRWQVELASNRSGEERTYEDWVAAGQALVLKEG